MDSASRPASSAANLAPEPPSELQELRRRVQELEAARAAWESERALFVTLMEHLPDRIYFKDRESRFLRVSRALATMHGLSSPAEAVGMTDADFFTREHAQQARDDERHILETGQPLVGEIEKETWSDGRATWVTTTKMPLRDAAGAIIGTFGVSRDITEAKQMQDELRESEERYRSLIASLAEGVVLIDREGVVRASNASAERIMGVTSDQLLGVSLYQSADKTFHEDGSPFAPDDYPALKTLRTGEPQHDIILGVDRPDGTRVWVSINSQPVMFEGDTLPRIVVASFHDVTQRKQAEEDLRNSERLYQSLVNTLTQAVCRKDLAGRFTFCNDRFCELLQHSREEILGKRSEDFFPAEQVAQFQSDDQLVLQRGETREMLREIRRPDGETVFMQTVKTPVRDSRGLVTGLQAVFWDVTQIRRHQEAMVFLAAIVQSSDDAIIGTDLNGTILSWNRGAERTYGYTAEEAVGLPISTLSSPRQNFENDAILQRVNAGDPLSHYETKRLTKDGREIDVSLNVSPLLNAEGRIIGVSTIARDITRRKIAEEAVFQLAAIVECSNDAIIGVSLEGTILSWNPAAENVYGYNCGEIRGHSLAVLAPYESQDEVFAMIGRVLAGERLEHYQTVHVHKSRQPISVSLTVSPIIHAASDRVSGVSLIARKIASGQSATAAR